MKYSLCAWHLNELERVLRKDTSWVGFGLVGWWWFLFLCVFCFVFFSLGNSWGKLVTYLLIVSELLPLTIPSLFGKLNFCNCTLSVLVVLCLAQVDKKQFWATKQFAYSFTLCIILSHAWISMKTTFMFFKSSWISFSLCHHGWVSTEFGSGLL